MFVYTIQPVVKLVVKPDWQPVVLCIQTLNRLSNPFDSRFDKRLYRVYSRLSNRLSYPFDNRFDNRLYHVNKHPTGCQTGLTTRWMFVYTIQPVVKPVVQPVWQPVVLYNQFDNQLYRVNGVLHSSLYVQLTVAHLSLGAVCCCLGLLSCPSLYVPLTVTRSSLYVQLTVAHVSFGAVCCCLGQLSRSSLYVQLTVAHLSLGAVCHCCSLLPHSLYVLTVCPCGYVVVLVCWCVHNELFRTHLSCSKWTWANQNLCVTRCALCC